ncbi:MAG: hypothetical protein ABSF69_09020 [Polyangiaceae bacterium]
MAFGVTGSKPHDDPASAPALLLDEAPELPLEEALALLLDEAPELLLEEAPALLLEEAPELPLELLLEEAPALLLEEAPELLLEEAPEPLLEGAPEPLEPALPKPTDGEMELAAELSDPGVVVAPPLAAPPGPELEPDADDPGLPPVADELPLHATAITPATTSVAAAERARRAETSYDIWRSNTIQGLLGTDADALTRRNGSLDRRNARRTHRIAPLVNATIGPRG